MRQNILILLSLLPLFFLLSKYKYFVYCIAYIVVFMLRIHYSYMEVDYLECTRFLEDFFKEPSTFFSENQSEDKFNKEFDKSLIRVKDFVKIAKKDGSGVYPEDFHYDGYKRDDGSITHSKSPKDWGIDESYDFGEYKDLTKRKTSAIQMASWLEYDYKVNERRCVIINSIDNTLNKSGTKWFRDYCTDNKIRVDNINSSVFRDDLRKFGLKSI